jgi:hypothetical protein
LKLFNIDQQFKKKYASGRVLDFQGGKIKEVKNESRKGKISNS